MMTVRQHMMEIIYEIEHEEQTLRHARAAGVSDEEIFGSKKEYMKHKNRQKLKRILSNYKDKV